MTLLPLLAVAGGLAALVWSADRFVAGAAGLATAFGMPPLLIGMVVVGFGTSAPEMLVSALAAFEGRPGLALGNAYGSNIANIGLILGLTALISPITVHSTVLRREVPILLGSAIAVPLLLRNGVLSKLEGAILIGCAVLFTIVTLTVSVVVLAVCTEATVATTRPPAVMVPPQTRAVVAAPTSMSAIATVTPIATRPTSTEVSSLTAERREEARAPASPPASTLPWSSAVTGAWNRARVT